MPMSNYQPWGQPNKNLLEPIMAFNNITAQMFSEISREYMQAANEFMHMQATDLQDLAQLKSIEDVMSFQSRFIANQAPKFHQHAQNMLDTLTQSATRYSEFFEKGLQQWSKESRALQDKMKF